MGEYLARNGLTTVEAQGAVHPGDETGGTLALKPVARRVALTVVSARELPDLDDGPGVTDPYVVIDYDGLEHETSVVEGSQEPRWGDSFIFDVRPGGVMVVRLMDEDALGGDETVGVVSQTLAPIRVDETQELEIPIRGGEAGVLSITLTGLSRP